MRRVAPTLVAISALTASCVHTPQPPEPQPTATVQAPPDAREATPERTPQRHARAYDRVQPGEVYLVPEFEKHLKRRAYLSTLHPMQWSEIKPPAKPGDEPVPEPKQPFEKLDDPPRVTVAERRPELLRIVFDAYGIYVTGYLPRPAFAQTVVAETPLLPRRNAPSTSPHGVRLKPGVLLKQRDVRYYDVTGTIDGFSLYGVVNAKAVGTVFTPVPVGTKSVLELVQRLEILDGPSGRVIAKLADSMVVAGKILDTQGAMTRVAIETELLKIDGWVPSTGVSKAEDFGAGGLGLSGWGSSHSIYLYHGTTIHSQPGGPVVGLVHDFRVQAYDYGAEGDHYKIGLHLPWELHAPPTWISKRDHTRATELDAVRDQRIVPKVTAGTRKNRGIVQALLDSRGWSFNNCLDQALLKRPDLTEVLEFDVTLGADLAARPRDASTDPVTSKLAECSAAGIQYKRGSSSKPALGASGSTVVSIAFEPGYRIVQRQAAKRQAP